MLLKIYRRIHINFRQRGKRWSSYSCICNISYKKKEERRKTIRDFYLFNLGGRTKV